MDAARRRVARALSRREFMRSRQWEIIGQGSYQNNTNVRIESDVDVCVCLTDAFFVEGRYGDRPTMTELGHVGLPFTYDQFKSEVESCLRQEFGAGAVDWGRKALHVHKDEADRISIDVVPAFQLHQFGSRRQTEPIINLRWASRSLWVENQFPSPALCKRMLQK
jgi:hypothetical protein